MNGWASVRRTRVLRLAAGSLATFFPVVSTAANAAPIGRAFDVGQQPAAIVVGDFNADGIPDVAVVDDEPLAQDGRDGRVSVFLGFGNGILRPPLRFPAGKTPVAMGAADFDGDGHPD